MRPGFSMIELLFVLIIGSVLMGMAVSGSGTYLARKGARDARDMFVYMATHARTAAIERGTDVRLVVDASTDRMVIRTGSTGSGEIVDEIQLSEFGARVTMTGGSSLTICYNPRGFAKETCSTNIGDTEVTFTRGGFSESATVRGLGQVKRK